MEKINIAELLKDCPKGMALYSPIFGEVYLDEIRPHLAIVVTTDKYKEEFLYDGRYGIKGECMLFPSKGKTTWEGFHRPFTDGDVIYNPDINAISILRSNDSEKSISHAFLNTLGDLIIKHKHSSDLSDWRFATEEEKTKLFKAIKDSGYKWNAETKTLEKLIELKFKVGDIITNGYITSVIKQITKDSYILDIKDNEICFNYVFFNNQDKWELVSSIKPKFKVGDRVRGKYTNNIHTISCITPTGYEVTNGKSFTFNAEECFELVPNKFDITSLKPFESKVLVRHNKGNKWTGSFFSFIDTDHHSYCYKFVTTAGKSYPMMIPYKGNEYLLGKTDDCNEFYKIWE